MGAGYWHHWNAEGVPMYELVSADNQEKRRVVSAFISPSMNGRCKDIGWSCGCERCPRRYLEQACLLRYWRVARGANYHIAHLLRDNGVSDHVSEQSYSNVVRAFPIRALASPHPCTCPCPEADLSLPCYWNFHMTP